MLIHKIARSLKSVEQFLQNIYFSASGIIKILIISKFNNTLPAASEESCIIFGNGPSLKKTLEEYQNVLKTKSIICVNNFATSSQYHEYRPANYVVLDPGYFIHKQRPDIMATFNEFKNTTWAMNLFIPYLYRRDIDVQELIKKNSFIKVRFYNYTILKGFNNIAFSFFKRNLAMPQLYNVLGASIFLCINMGYKYIYITGADHSWFDNIHVGEDNRLYRKDMHFYDKGNQPLLNVFETVSGKTQTIGDFLQALYKMFDSYYLLKKYAEIKKCSIYNSSEFSYIDAFERKKITDLN